MYVPPPLNDLNDVIVTPYGKHSCGLSISSGGTPSSGTMDRTYFYPLRLWSPFTVAKAGWVNGATAGTDNLDIGVYRMTDRATGRMDLLRSTGVVLASGTNQVQSTAVFRVARANLTSGNDSTDSTTYTTASVTLKAGRLYLLSIVNTAASAAAVASIAGGPTWTSRSTTQFNTTGHRTSIWSGVPTVDYTGTVVVTFGATQTGACWVLDEMSGVDTSSNDGIVQNAVGTGNSTTPLATLAAFGSANNATYGAHGVANASTVAPGSGFTELAEATAATPASRVETEWRVDNDTTVDATCTSGQWGSCAVEIKADASTFVIPPGPDLYMAFGPSGTTTTVFRVSSIGAVLATGVLQSTTAASIPLPSNITPSGLAINIGRIPIAGFSSRSTW